MRWERLFADLEAHGDAMALDERDQLVDELTDETWSSLRWRDLLGGVVTLEVAGHGVVSGDVTVANEHVVFIQTATAEMVIHPRAVLAVMDTEQRADVLGPVARRWGWQRVWRSMRDAGEEVTVTRPDGTTLRGTVERVGQDFAIIDTGTRRTLVTNETVAMLSCRR